MHWMGLEPGQWWETSIAGSLKVSHQLAIRAGLEYPMIWTRQVDPLSFHCVFQEQQRALRQMEEMQALEEKRQRQQEMRNVLNLTLRMKMKKEAKEEQEQLAFDMKMLEQLLEESRNEAMEQEQRKVKICLYCISC